MRSLSTNINTKSQSFNENHEQMLELVKKLEKHLVESRFEGKEKHVEKARNRGKMLARERIELVLDKDSPFLELLPLAGMEKKDGLLRQIYFHKISAWFAPQELKI